MKISPRMNAHKSKDVRPLLLERKDLLMLSLLHSSCAWTPAPPQASLRPQPRKVCCLSRMSAPSVNGKRLCQSHCIDGRGPQPSQLRKPASHQLSSSPGQIHCSFPNILQVSLGWRHVCPPSFSLSILDSLLHREDFCSP